MKRSLTLFAIVSLFVLACEYQPSAAQSPTTPIPITPPANSTRTESRFGIDYVYPLNATYRNEKWPELFAQAGAEWGCGSMGRPGRLTWAAPPSTGSGRRLDTLLHVVRSYSGCSMNYPVNAYKQPSKGTVGRGM